MPANLAAAHRSSEICRRASTSNATFARRRDQGRTTQKERADRAGRVYQRRAPSGLQGIVPPGRKRLPSALGVPSAHLVPSGLLGIVPAGRKRPPCALGVPSAHRARPRVPGVGAPARGAPPAQRAASAGPSPAGWRVRCRRR
eukprot:5371536-Prymnesium_polylepis.1